MHCHNISIRGILVENCGDYRLNGSLPVTRVATSVTSHEGGRALLGTGAPRTLCQAARLDL